MIRKAIASDIPAIAAIYEALHTEEERGRSSTGWIRGVYPTRQIAEEGVLAGEMVVLEEAGTIRAAARINQVQCEEYAQIPWEFDAPEDQVLVLHTLVVSPDAQGRGCAGQILDHYEKTARERQCTVLRIDTNVRNEKARGMYRKHGFRESGIVDCIFNGIPDVQMICLEKKINNKQ